jgi:hypothetical protein
VLEDEIFLTLYHKLEEIEKYKNEYFQENKQKFEKLNSILSPFTNQILKITDSLTNTLENYLNNDIFDNFTNSTRKYIVDKIEKESVNYLMFKNIGFERKSLCSNKIDINTAINEAIKIYISHNKEKNSFQKELYSPQQNGLFYESLDEYDSACIDNQIRNGFNFYYYSNNNHNYIQSFPFTSDIQIDFENTNINIIHHEEDNGGNTGNISEELKNLIADADSTDQGMKNILNNNNDQTNLNKYINPILELNNNFKCLNSTKR